MVLEGEQPEDGARAPNEANHEDDTSVETLTVDAAAMSQEGSRAIKLKRNRTLGLPSRSITVLLSEDELKLLRSREKGDTVVISLIKSDRGFDSEDVRRSGE